MGDMLLILEIVKYAVDVFSLLRTPFLVFLLFLHASRCWITEALVLNGRHRQRQIKRDITLSSANNYIHAINKQMNLRIQT